MDFKKNNKKEKSDKEMKFIIVTYDEEKEIFKIDEDNGIEVKEKIETMEEFLEIKDQFKKKVVKMLIENNCLE